ncbi:MAG: hypothetical protein WC755_06570 [Candidatus Woesearchaeota archaeon]|jgi:CheY-like chemotaxis protein
MEKTNGKKYTILVVDDDLAICKLTSRFLSTNENYHAIEYPVQGKFNLNELAKKYANNIEILIHDFDLNISGCDGLDISKTFKETPDNTIKGYIMITGSTISNVQMQMAYTQ